MTEENIIAEFVDNEYEAIEVLDLTPVATKSETVQVVNAEDIEMFTVSTEESFPALGEPNEQLKHSLLMGRDLPDQHPITAITGLRNELDNIEALQTVYSDKKQNADFYKWEDENPNNENRVGYFVTVCNNIKNIKICQGENIFGVTVDSAAFIGGQDDIARDYKYSLVTHSGIVNVRCELDVVVGDFVVSNDYGIAERTGNTYGCKVISINEIDGVRCATVCLNLPVEQLDSISQELIDFNVRMEATEKGVVSAMNLANEAYNKAVGAGGASEDALNNATDALNQSNDALEQLGNSISEFQRQIEQAKEISRSAEAHAEALRTEAVGTANDALTNVNDLITKYEPLEEWVDPETGKIGATYVINYMNENGLATTVDIRTVDTKTEDNKSAIERNAENFTSLVSSVDKYSVGEYSQAYGLTHEQAKNILKVGMIYIPTENNSKNTHEEEYLDTGEVNEFTKGRYYTWDGEDWIESAIGRVNFAKLEPSTTLNDYWYIDSNEAPSGYESKTLYIAQDSEWVKVNTLAGNCNNRVSSMIRQTANKIALEVTNARGSYSGLDVRLDEENKAYTSMVASVAGTDGKITAASIVAAVNESDSSVAINADKIVMTGTTTFLTADDVGSSGGTIIDGGRITTGIIKSSNEATWINLDKGTFQFSNKNGKEVLSLDTSNNLNIYGQIKSSDFPKFSIQVGPSRQYNGSNGAFTVTDTSAGTIFSNHDIFQVYKVGISDAEGVVWTAPFLTNTAETNRKGVAVFPDSIGIFNDVGAKYTNDQDEVSYPWITQVSVKENTVLLSNGKTEISLADDNTGLWVGGGTDFWFNGGSVPSDWTTPTRYVFNNPNGGYAAITCGGLNSSYCYNEGNIYTKGIAVGKTTGESYENYVLSIFGNTYSEGSISASSVINRSDRALKTNIEEAELSALDKISQLKFYSYDYKNSEQEETEIITPVLYNSPSSDEEDVGVADEIIIEETTTSNPIHIDLGIMADEAPTEIQSSDGKGIDLYSYISLNAKAVQELILKIQTLEEEIQNLKNGEM